MKPRLLRQRVCQRRWEALLLCPGRTPKEAAVRAGGEERPAIFRLRKKRWLRRGGVWKLEADLPAGGEVQSVRVEFTDGTTLGAKDVSPEGLAFSWDAPVEGSRLDTALSLSGWIARPDAPPELIECHVDGVRVGEIRLDVPRPDVRAALGNLPDDLVGFAQHLSVPPSARGQAGAVALSIRFRDGAIWRLSRPVTRVPFMDEEERTRVRELMAESADLDGRVARLEHPPLYGDGPRLIAVCRLDPFWRTGFSEWRRVLRCEPKFPGHEQPCLPLSGEFEDVSHAEVWEEWGRLVCNYGLAGLCLEINRADDPWLEALPSLPGPDYCFRWVGTEGPDEELLRVHFESARYLKVDGKPIFLTGVRAFEGQSAPPPEAMDPSWRGRCMAFPGEESVDGMPLVRVAWDSEPERPFRGDIVSRASVENYRERLFQALKRGRVVLLESWNDWLRSSQLEPDHRRGYARLQATRDVLEEFLLEPASAEASEAKLAVVIHLYYRDLWDEIATYLDKIRVPFRLHVSVAGGVARGITRRIRAKFPNAVIHDFENRGRDVLPFFRIAKKLAGEGVETVLKIHSKKSVHRGDGIKWRQDLYGKLMDKADEFAARFDGDKKLGMIGPAGHLLSTECFVGSNLARMEDLARMCGLPADTWKASSFFAGTMFWCRLEAVRPLLELWPERIDFETEAGQTDGTLGHAVERMLLPLLMAGGHRAEDTEGRPVSAGSQSYDHAANG